MLRQAFIEVAPPVANLLARAEEGIERSDWKFAIDSLQRVIEDPQRSLVRREDVSDEAGAVFESARLQALRRLASLPPEGLQAYRLLFDGKAKSLYRQAVDTHDSSKLWRIVTQYFLTRHGDLAADTLASWELDAGRSASVIGLVEAIRNIYPDSKLPQARLVGKLAAAYTLLGRSDIAKKTISDYLTQSPASSADSWLSQTYIDISNQRNLHFERDRQAESWPTVGGTAERTGAMLFVEPSFDKPTPWRFNLPDAWSAIWGRILTQESHDRMVLPFSQIVTDKKRLFVRTATGVIALDLEDLSKLWEYSEGEVVVVDRSQPPSSIDASFDRASEPPDLDNQVSAAISVAGGLVYMLEGSLPPTVSVRPNPAMKTSVFWHAGARKLLALSARTGEIVWTVGLDAGPNAVWADVAFRAAPLEAEGKLWVPFTRRTQYYVAVLDPLTGALLKRIALCSVSVPPIALRRTIELAYSDGTVIAPTEEGVVVAIDTADYSLRWANQYMAKPFGTRNLGDPTGYWLPSSPVIVDGRVLLTSIETGRLHCFDLVTGEMLWQVAVDGGQYIVAAAMGKVWLGGRMISCLSLDNGSRLWATETATTMTGRAGLSGSRILVPVRDGLLTLDAFTGDRLSGGALVDGEPPLGNLLCLRSSLYSLDPAGVRRFPDFERLYPETKAFYESNNADVSATLHLAQLELLKGDASRAYQLLTEPSLDLKGETDAHLVGRVEHALVEALLELAKRPGSALDDRLTLLQQASAYAKSSQDMFRCQMGTVDELLRMGQLQEAYQRAFDYGLSKEAKRHIAIGANLSMQARYAVAIHLRKRYEQLSADSRVEIEDWIGQQCASALKVWRESKPTVSLSRRLRALADLDSTRKFAPELLIELANWNLGRRRYERAQLELDACARLKPDRELALLTEVVLARLLAEPYQFVRSTLRAKLADLERQYKGSKLPLRWKHVWNVPGVTDDSQTLEDWIESVRDSLDMKALDVSLPSLVGTDLQFNEINEPLWVKKIPNRGPVPRLVEFVGGRPRALADQVLYYDKDDIIASLSPADGGAERWQAPLRLPGTFQDKAVSAGSINIHGCRIVADGQTGIINTYQGLFAFGLRTGKRLWVYPQHALGSKHPSQRTHPTMAVSDGMLAASVAPGQLMLVRLSDGQLLWRRSLRGETIGQVAIQDGVVIVVDDDNERVHLIRLSDGRLIDLVRFNQHNRKGDDVELVWDGGLVIGPDRRNGTNLLVAYDIQTGQVSWKSEIDKPLVGLFSPAPRYVIAGLLLGYVRLLDSATGELIVEHRITKARRITGGVFVDGLLVARELDWNQQRNDTKPTLYGLDLATGDNLWQRDGLATQLGRVRPMRVVGRILPIVMLQSDPVDRRKLGLLSVGFLDTRSGELIGSKRKIGRSSATIQFDGDLDWWDDTLVVGTNEGLTAFALNSDNNVTNQRGGSVD